MSALRFAAVFSIEQACPISSSGPAQENNASFVRRSNIMRPPWRQVFFGIVAWTATTIFAHAQSADHIFADSFEFTTKLAQPDIAIAFSDASVWTPLKARCERDLATVIEDIYAGFDWRQAAQDYGICYNVALMKGDARAPLYSKKAVAILKTLSRSFPVIAVNQNHQFLGFGDGLKKSFTLPMPPLAGAVVRVFENTAAVTQFTYTSTPQQDITQQFDKRALYPVLRISASQDGAISNSPAEYVQEVDFHISMRDDDIAAGTSYFNVLHWIGTNHPSPTYYVATNLNENNTEISAGKFSISGTTLLFNTAPIATQSLFVQYVGSDYTQTSNLMGGVESVKPDGPGYDMRAMNVGLAYGYDAVRHSPDLTAGLRKEFYTVLNQQVDWYTQAGYEGPHVYSNPIGNYYIRGYLMGTFFTAYATDTDNPRAMSGGDLKPLAHSLLMQTFNRMQAVLPDAYGPQGQYSEGTNEDMLQLFDAWKRLSPSEGVAEDLASISTWNANLVPATIHGTKPDRVTFYDGGDWDGLPAKPLVESMQAFLKYQPNHSMAPYARQYLADVGSPVAGAKADYKTGASSFPLSYLAKFTGPMYARSDWGTVAVWVSMADGLVLEDHQHRDAGHITLQRGADYLVINSGGYGITETLPSHNTLGFDDRGAGDHIVYPPGQGYWGDNAKITKYIDQGTFVYGLADIGNAYVNNDGVTNSVTRAARTLVYIRPNVVFVHDQMQVAKAAIKKIFNLNFNAPSLVQSGDVFSAAHGNSKVFMRALVPANPVPTITHLDYNDGHSNVSNYQLTTSGQTSGTFLHLFQLTDSGQATMAKSTYVASADGREQGAEVDLGTRRWIVMAATVTPPVLNTSALVYSVPQSCPCTHVITDLMASTGYQITILGGAGSTIQATSDANGLLTFQTENAATTGVQIH
ncbi:hypothetical protein ELE36_12905 [Pseudolysobacter antarcticus]|uniref:Uncharacterized protein n=1 Tax=Pseudolysobacter antarcticus TaxID=2511995 RepID=A0A411HKX4_9GAMM|nr:hypothetical protein [Pseudolysobacter antarcticus]QBB71179.1 hypothetical protein ELE36_12905 [Pseudolysobacter antarcticus]